MIMELSALNSWNQFVGSQVQESTRLLLSFQGFFGLTLEKGIRW